MCLCVELECVGYDGLVLLVVRFVLDFCWLNGVDLGLIVYDEFDVVVVLVRLFLIMKIFKSDLDRVNDMIGLMVVGFDCVVMNVGCDMVEWFVGV